MITRAHPMLRKIHTNDDIDDKARWCAQKCELFQTDTQLDAFSMAHGMPSVPGSGAGRLRRAMDWQFWRRIVRRLVSQWRDQLMRHLGYIHRHRQIYCCDHVVAWQKTRAEANQRILQRIVGTSNTGEEMTLANIQDGSVANPRNRFNELMTRSRGMEEYAADNGYTPIAVTLTAPSKNHARHQHGAPNKKYNGATPRDTNDYLVNVFALTRAAIKRRGFEWFGYRVVEAHHDGTPHWHLLLFIRETDQRDLEAIFRHYALLEDGRERGARQHRVEFVNIDKRRGSATGYMIKYIAKNIAGAATAQEDLFGNKTAAVEARVVAWARTWRIRQFQFFGQPSVSVWREYRRIREVFEVVPPHTIPWVDADESNWRRFIGSMGTGRNQRSALVRGPRVNPDTGECTSPFNRYGEPLQGNQMPILGIDRDGMFLDTRTKFWAFNWHHEVSGQYAGKARNPGNGAAFAPWTCVTNCTRERARGPPNA